MKSETSTFQILLNHTDNAGKRTILYILDLWSPKAQFYSSLKHVLVGGFTDGNVKKCNHVQDENCLCDKSNSLYFTDIQRLPTKLSDYFSYKFEDNSQGELMLLSFIGLQQLKFCSQYSVITFFPL